MSPDSVSSASSRRDDVRLERELREAATNASIVLVACRPVDRADRPARPIELDVAAAASQLAQNALAHLDTPSA
jgi:hypothetical protein